MAEEAGWGAWVRMIPSPGETFAGELSHSSRNPVREGVIGSQGGHGHPWGGQEEGDKWSDLSLPRTAVILWENTETVQLLIEKIGRENRCWSKSSFKIKQRWNASVREAPRVKSV